MRFIFLPITEEFQVRTTLIFFLPCRLAKISVIIPGGGKGMQKGMFSFMAVVNRVVILEDSVASTPKIEKARIL